VASLSLSGSKLKLWSSFMSFTAVQYRLSRRFFAWQFCCNLTGVVPIHNPRNPKVDAVALPQNQTTAKARRILLWHFLCAWILTGNSDVTMGKTGSESIDGQTDSPCSVELLLTSVRHT
jgi:hypothetical protein